MSNTTIVVTEIGGSVVVLEAVPQTIEIIDQGPAGPTGTTGAPGGTRLQTVVNAVTVTPTADLTDVLDITALAQDVTIENATGDIVNFQKLIIRIRDAGVSCMISWGTAYISGGSSLPDHTVGSKILTLGFIYNTANSLNKWQLVALSREA